MSHLYLVVLYNRKVCRTKKYMMLYKYHYYLQSHQNLLLEYIQCPHNNTIHKLHPQHINLN